MDARSLALVAIAGSVIAIGAPPAGLAQQQSFDGAYKGSLECEQMPEDIRNLRTPLAMIVRNGMVVASASMFDLDGRQELADTVVTGTVNANGVFHLGVTVFARDASSHVDYTGTFNTTGGTLTGTQVWTRATAGDGGATRTCNGTFVKVTSPGQ
jgi:hypothetical protein